jgi:hypothetical protein
LGKGDRNRKDRRETSGRPSRPGAVGMAPDEPLPPHKSAAFERREAAARILALQILLPYLATQRKSSTADAASDAEIIAEHIAQIRPADTMLVVNGFRLAEVAFGEPVKNGFPPNGERWRQGAQPAMLLLCPPQHRDHALTMMERRIAVEESHADFDVVHAFSTAMLEYPVATIHAEAAMRSWMFTQPDLLAAGPRAELKIAEFLLSGTAQKPGR